MSDGTAIEWCDATWNPVRGCSSVSEGCRRCYAAAVAARFSGPDQPYAGLARRVNGHPAWTGEVRLVPEALDLPLKWRKPRRIFVNSMSDLFHEKLSDDDIAAVFGVMAAAPRHTFIVLTKRAKRMYAWFEWIAGFARPSHECWNRTQGRFGFNARCHRHARQVGVAWPLPNVILGVSVEDQATAAERIPDLLATPTACRAVSYEPALGPVDLSWPLGLGAEMRRRGEAVTPAGYLGGLDWVIVGGESGPGARPCDVEWIRATVRACREAGVACFMKQLGSLWALREREVSVGGKTRRRARTTVHPKGGDPAEWPEDLRVREFPVSQP